MVMTVARLRRKRIIKLYDYEAAHLLAEYPPRDSDAPAPALPRLADEPRRVADELRRMADELRRITSGQRAPPNGRRAPSNS